MLLNPGREIHAGVALLFEASNDYQTISAKEETYGMASIASAPIPSYMVQASWALFYRLGMRLKYKTQKAVFDEPDEKNLKNKSHTLNGATAELVYQFGQNLQTYIHYQNQDRLLLSMKNPSYLELFGISSNEYGVGFNWETENKPGFKFGYGGWLSYVNFGASKDNEISLDQGIEIGASIKLGFLTRRGWGYWTKAQYSVGEFSGSSYDFNIRDLYIGVGLSKYFGF